MGAVTGSRCCNARLIRAACCIPFLCAVLNAADSPARAQLTSRLSESVNSMLGDGTVKVWANCLGELKEMKVRGADAANLTVDVQGNPFALPWAKFSDRELLDVAKSIGGSNGARLMLAAEVAASLNFTAEATALLVRVRECDPDLSEDALALAAQLPQSSVTAPASGIRPAISAVGAKDAAGAKSTAPTLKNGAAGTPGAPLPLSGGAPARVFALTQTAGPADYLGKLDKLKPGDVLLLQSGVYTSDLQLAGLAGTKERRIVITGPVSGPRAVFVANSRHNTVELRDCTFVDVCNLELDGKGLDAPAGVCAKDGKTHDIGIEGLYIHDYSGSQGTDGISTKMPTWNWTIRNNVIERCGTGMYLGNSDGSCPFVNGLIEHNLIVDTVGYNIQIKHQKSRPEIPGITRATTIIRHNVFVKSRMFDNSIGARPNLLVGHPPDSGIGTDDLFLIYGNFFWKNPKEALFQGEGHIAFFDNVCVNPDNAGVRIMKHNGKVKTVAVFNNTVVAKGGGIDVSGAEPGYSQFIVANAVFGSGVHGPGVADNITGSYESAAQFLANPFGGIGNLDCFPLPGKLRGPQIDVSRFKDYLEAGRDFNGNAQDGSWRGAYAGEGKNPGWSFSVAKKTPGGIVADKKMQVVP